MEPPGRSDAALLAAHAAGDDSAFPELVRRHSDRMYSLALRTTGNRDEAADALQDAFIKAFRSAESFAGRSQVGTWLHRIVVNACLDRMRTRRSRATVPLPAEDGPDLPPAPGDLIAEREVRLTVDQALSKLPEDQRVVVVLVDIEGYPVAEAAALLGIPAGTVKSRCARGRARLTVLLGHLRNPEVFDSVQASGVHTSQALGDRDGRPG